MRVKALVSFCGVISMRRGSERELEDKALIKDLQKAGYIEVIETERKKSPKKKER